MRAIRTQFGMNIVLAERITSISTTEINSRQEEPRRIVAYFHGEDHCVLGVYTTEKRRQRVLRMLEDWLTLYLCDSNIALAHGNDAAAFTSIKEYMLFQMPHDNESLDTPKPIAP